MTRTGTVPARELCDRLHTIVYAICLSAGSEDRGVRDVLDERRRNECYGESAWLEAQANSERISSMAPADSGIIVDSIAV